MTKPAGPASNNRVPALRIVLPAQTASEPGAAQSRLGDREVRAESALGPRVGLPQVEEPPGAASSAAVEHKPAKQLIDAIVLVKKARRLLDALSLVGHADSGLIQTVRESSQALFTDTRSNWAGEAGIFCALMEDMNEGQLESLRRGIEIVASPPHNLDGWALDVIRGLATEFAPGARRLLV